MKIIAMVPIKMENERLPGKNIKLLGGVPLIHYILKTLRQSELIQDIYVYCSDENIKEYLPEGVIFLKRPKFLDEKTSNFTQIFQNFSKEIDSDIYVFTHATAPFISLKTLDKCIKSVISGKNDSAFTVAKIQDFLWQNNLPLNFDAANIPRSQDLTPIYRETSGLYVFTQEVFNKYQRRVGIKPKLIEVTYKEAIDINNPEDFELAEVFNQYSL